MKNLKYVILFIILIMTIGIAAVSSNLLINGSTPIASNPDDFNVYFSNVLVNGIQDLSLVKNEDTLVFNSEFSAVGDEVEVLYSVTNASLNYDADISVTCGESTSYLTISNYFDTDSYLSARSTRSGILTVTLSKSYTGSDLTQNISCTISASAVERTSQLSNDVDSPLEPSITSFNVCGYDYNTYYNMTWKDWVESDFNDGNFYINGNSIVRTVVGGYDAPVSDYYDDDYHDAKDSDLIIAGKAYVCD